MHLVLKEHRLKYLRERENKKGEQNEENFSTWSRKLGTALALVLADNHHDVHMWGHRQELIDQINEKHENHDYLPNVSLPASIKATTDMKQALEGTDAIIVAVPTKAIREVLKQANELIISKVPFVHVSKGIEPDTLLRISQMIEQEVPDEKEKLLLSYQGRAMPKK